MVNLTIDGKTVSVPPGSTILEAARKIDINIPTLCWLEKVSPTGACRACVVEIEGLDRPMTACNTPVKEGIVVTTRTENLALIRRQVVQLLLVNHPLDCPVCDAGGECGLQDICHDLDVDFQPYHAEDVAHGVIDSWPLIKQVPSRCILCEKCVKVCNEVVGAQAIVVRERGERAFIDTHDGGPLDCEFCGNCVAECPTGTLLSKPFLHKARPWEMTKIPSLCTYCGSQCEIEYNVKNDRVQRVTSTNGVTVNDGNLCIGGAFGYGYIDSEHRLSGPLVRVDGIARKTGWDEALEMVAGKIREVKSAFGPDALAGLSSPRLTNEENYLFQKFFRTAVGTNNIDSEARFGALRSLLTLDAALGLKGSSHSLDNIGRSDAVLVFGCDATAEAPAIDWQIEQACRKRSGKLVLANMRRVKLSRYADSFLQYRPGSEIALAKALTRILLDRGLADLSFLESHVENFKQLQRDLQDVNLEKTAEATGLSPLLLEEAALHLGQAGSVALVFGGDITKSRNAEEKIAALANLALVCGVLNGEAGGLFPVDEKGNMQGLLDMGVFPESLPGHRKYAEARKDFGTAWGTSLPEGGKNAFEILEGIEKGEIRFLYLAAANPLNFPDGGRWRKALEKLDFLLVQDILVSDITALASVVLPGTSSAEKKGSFTSLDHRTGYLEQAVSPRGDARPDLEILGALYRSLVAFPGPLKQEDIFKEIGVLTSLYEDAGSRGRRFFSRQSFRPEKGRMQYIPVREEKPADGLQLLTGKILFHFGTTSTFAEGNLEVSPEGYIEIHPRDAKASGIADGETVRISSELGEIQGRVKLSQNLLPGLLFAPYHFRALDAQKLMPAGENLVEVKITRV